MVAGAQCARHAALDFVETMCTFDTRTVKTLTATQVGSLDFRCRRRWQRHQPTTESLKRLCISLEVAQLA